jgi:hypothetical protein
MTTFKVRVVSGGIVRQTFSIEAESLADAVLELGATVVDVKPGWAFAQYGPLSSASIAWDENVFRAQRNHDMGDAVRASLGMEN